MQSDKFILKKKIWDTWSRSKNTTAVDFKIGRVENGSRLRSMAVAPEPLVP